MRTGTTARIRTKTGTGTNTGKRIATAPGGRLTRTKYEEIMEKAFRDEGFNASPYMFICWWCHNWTENENAAMPEICPHCFEQLKKGDYARPDLVVNFNWGAKAAVRIDGEKIHNRSYRRIAHDDTQFKKFRDRGIPCFVIYNEEIELADDWMRRAMVHYIHQAALFNSTYDRYLELPSIVGRTNRKKMREM